MLASWVILIKSRVILGCCGSNTYYILVTEEYFVEVKLTSVRSTIQEMEDSKIIQDIETCDLPSPRSCGLCNGPCQLYKDIEITQAAYRRYRTNDTPGAPAAKILHPHPILEVVVVAEKTKILDSIAKKLKSYDGLCDSQIKPSVELCEWRESDRYQAQSRPIRTRSHDILPHLED